MASAKFEQMSGVCHRCKQGMSWAMARCPNCGLASSLYDKAKQQSKSTANKILLWLQLFAIGCGGYYLFSYAAAINSPAEQDAAQVDITPIDRDKTIRDAIWEMTPEQFPRVYRQWGTNWVQRLNRMLYQVAEKVWDTPGCDTIQTVGLSESRSVPKRSAVFYADCVNGQRFYVSDKDLAADARPTSNQERMSNLKDSDAVARCIEGVRLRMNYPSTFSSSIFQHSVYRAPVTANAVVTIDFQGKNGLGLELPMTARCIFDSQGHQETQITNR